MRVLTRMRPLVAIAALLLLTLAPIAQANVPGRPIDRPEGPPDVVPTQIGDPDAGQEIIVVLYRGQPVSLHLPTRLVHWLLRASGQRNSLMQFPRFVKARR